MRAPEVPPSRRVAARLVMLGGAGLGLWLASRVGLDVIGAAAGAAGPALVVVAALEAVGIACESHATSSLVPGAGRVQLRAALAAWATAQVLPGGRAVGEVVRAAHLSPATGMPRAVRAVLVLHAAHVAGAGLTAALGASVLAERSPVVATALGGVAAWNAGLVLVLALAHRSHDLLGRVARHVGLSLPSAARPSSRAVVRASVSMLAARGVHGLQAIVLVRAALGGSLDEGLAAELAQVLAAAAGDAVPGQLGALESSFTALGSLVSPRDGAGALAVLLLLRASRLALLVPALAAHLALGRDLSAIIQRASMRSERAPIPRLLASSVLVLGPVILLAFEPDGVRHPLAHQLESLVAVWLYAAMVVAILHVGTELVGWALDRRGSDGRSVPALVLGAIVALAAVVVVSVPVAPILAAVCPGIAGHEDELVLRGALLGAVYLAVGLALGATLRAWLAARLSVAEAERVAVEARLAALTARTQPHFLANALNTIAATVREDPEKAERLVEDLGGLFSHALTGSAERTVALEDELGAARSYLAVQAARFGDRLRFEVETEALVGDERVPALSILPLVENAVLHGLSRPGTKVHVVASVRRGGSDLVIEVKDDGPGPSGTTHVGHKKGLAELGQRLDLAFGPGRARVALDRVGDETRASLVLPSVMAVRSPA